MKTIFKHLGSLLCFCFFIFIAFASEDNDKTGASSQDAAVTKKVGETLSTEYFDVRINAVGTYDRVSTGNEFSDLPHEEANKYLVMNITFKNTSNESRMLLDGEVLVNYNGKDYAYDKPETVMAEGWGLLMDQINPLTSKTTNLVYKIPRELAGTGYYRPGRSSDDDLIDLGTIK